MYKNKLKVMKKSNVFCITVEKDLIIPNGFIKMLLSKFRGYKIYNINNWYCKVNKESIWQTLNTKNGGIYYQEIKNLMFKSKYASKQLRKGYLTAEVEDRDGSLISFEAYEDMHKSQILNTVYIAEKSIEFCNKIYKEKEVYNIFKEHSVLSFDLNTDGLGELCIELYDKTFEKVIDVCIYDYNRSILV